MDTFSIDLDRIEKKEVTHTPDKGQPPLWVVIAKTKEEEKENDKED